ncbi:MAG TPA: cytochrome C oxidase subunit IV family protein [Pseudolabrys sp.]|nr:cytochrome C oxidase subunit IV family protein [Pseudolabrys sp.]
MTFVAPTRAVLVAFAALIVLLAVTTALAYVPLHGFNALTAFTIATLKALVVAVVFMELREARGLMLAVAAAGFFWLSILLWFVWNDITTRTDFPPNNKALSTSPPAAGRW